MLSKKATQVASILLEHNFHKNKLYDRSLLAHLVKTYLLLKKWQSSDEVALVGLCHSIYEKCEGYPESGLPISYRKTIASILSSNIEKLAYLFSQGEYNQSIVKNCNASKPHIILNSTNEKFYLTRNEMNILVEVSAANMAEQIIYLKDRVTDKQKISLLQPYKYCQKYLSEMANDCIEQLLS